MQTRPTPLPRAAALLLLALAGCGGGTERPPLVLLVSVDTLRADRLGAYGSDRGLTPRLDELAARSEVFEAAYAPASFTVPSMSAVLTGRHPRQNRILINENVLLPSVPTLAEALHAAGYRTGAVVSNFVLRGGTGLEQGFERYDDRQPQAEVARGLPERIAPDTTDDALELLDQLRSGGRPTFLWVHYQDPHGPYTPPEDLLAEQMEAERGRPGAERRLPFGKDHRGLDGIPTYQRIRENDQVGFYRASYDAEVRFTDAEIGRLLDGVAARGLLEDAVVVFLADHGEGLGEDDYWFAHGEYLSDPLVRVPLFLAAPGRAPGRRTEVVGLVDVLPTVLGLVGVPPPEGVIGRDVLAGGPADSTLYLATLGGSTVPRLGLVEDGYKYVVRLAPGAGGVAEERLYRVGDETRDLAAEQPERLQRMRTTLDRLHVSMSAEGDAVLQDLTPEDLEMLRKLGYAGH